MKFLGISAFYHDSAACLTDGGTIVAAAQEERFSRLKHDSGFPALAIDACMKTAGWSPGDIDYVVFFEKPFLKFERLLETYFAYAPRGMRSFVASFPAWIKEKLFQKNLLCDHLEELWGDRTDWRKKLLFSEHHLSHAASAFFPSPFHEAAVLTLDGVGEWATTTLAVGEGSRLTMLKEIAFPHSLGLLYSAFTYYTGFKVNSGEYKVMGLAPYGRPVYADRIREHLIDIKADGSYALDLSYFDYCTGLTMTNRKFDALFGAPARLPEAPLTQRDMDLAASIQVVTEEVVLRLARFAAAATGKENLCLAGGVALNCVANGKLLREGIFKDLWIQPAAGDAGGALGAALAAHYLQFGGERANSRGDGMRGAYLGPAYTQQEIESQLRAAGARFSVLDDEPLLDTVAKALADGKAVGWHQGRMEFGPRALGGRSIIADPRSPTIQKMLNLKIKYRESFRPFAPSVLREEASDWFELDCDSPYMLLVADVAAEKRLTPAPDDRSRFGIDLLNVPRSAIPAVTHVDYSARVQTVHRDTHPRYHALISRFKALTGCPVLVNTSFNVRGEPIVATPLDAFTCFMGTQIEMLAIGNALLYKEEQDSTLARDYAHAFAPD